MFEGIPELNYVGMIELPQVPDVGLLLLFDFFNCHYFTLVLAAEDSSLGTGPQPLQIGYWLEGDLPIIYNVGSN